MGDVLLGVLGEVGMWLRGRPVDLGHARRRAVLGALLVDANTAVPVDRLIDRVWGEEVPARARTAVRTYLSHLRKVLEPAGAAIDWGRHGYTLTVDEDAVDLHRFRRLVDRARQAPNPKAALATADEALALWRGEPLAGLDTPWARSVRDAAEQERVAAEVDRVDWALSAGASVELLPRLRALAADHPLDERIAAQTMLALHRGGRRAQALAHYDRVRQVLITELGADPGAGLRALHDELLRTEAPDPAPPPAARAPRRRDSVVGTALATTAVLATAAVLAASSPAVEAELPAPGDYRFRLAHSGLCLSEDPAGSSGRVRQLDCAEAMPERALRRLSGDVYLVPTDHPELGPGCMGLPAGTTAVGAEVHDDYCDTGAAQAFQITAESDGFRIRAAHSGLCLGVPEAAMEEWAPLLQLPCDPVGSGQLFRFDPVGRVDGGPPG